MHYIELLSTTASHELVTGDDLADAGRGLVGANLTCKETTVNGINSMPLRRNPTT